MKIIILTTIFQVKTTKIRVKIIITRATVTVMMTTTHPAQVMMLIVQIINPAVIVPSTQYTMAQMVLMSKKLVFVLCLCFVSFVVCGLWFMVYGCMMLIVCFILYRQTIMSTR